MAETLYTAKFTNIKIADRPEYVTVRIYFEELLSNALFGIFPPVGLTMSLTKILTDIAKVKQFSSNVPGTKFQISIKDGIVTFATSTTAKNIKPEYKVLVNDELSALVKAFYINILPDYITKMYSSLISQAANTNYALDEIEFRPRKYLDIGLQFGIPLKDFGAVDFLLTFGNLSYDTGALLHNLGLADSVAVALYKKLNSRGDFNSNPSYYRFIGVEHRAYPFIDPRGVSVRFFPPVTSSALSTMSDFSNSIKNGGLVSFSVNSDSTTPIEESYRLIDTSRMPEHGMGQPRVDVNELPSGPEDVNE
jgi:hypothetical protein